MIRWGGYALLLAALLSGIFLFRVRKVNVYGNSRHSAGEISKGLTHDAFTKNTLYLLWKYRDEKIPDTLPFLNSLSVKMKSPFEIDVTVSEKELIGYVDKGDCVYFDQEGVVLEITGKEYKDLTLVTGADVEEPTLYQKLPTASSAQLRTILSVIQLLDYQEARAKEIRFDENGNIIVYIGGVEARLGQDEYLEEKIANLGAILKYTEDANGILHLESFTGKNEASSFPFTITEPETESEEETSAGEDAADGETGNGGNEAGTGENAPVDGEDAGAEDSGDAQPDEPSGATIAMVFNSSGTLVYNVHVADGVVVDAYGTPVDGCTIDENGYVTDAYMNKFDPQTGELVQ